MKTLIFTMLVVAAQVASANILSVEFAKCSQSVNTCALVYADQTTGVNYEGQEMNLSDSSQISEQDFAGISSQIEKFGRTFAMNVEGQVILETHMLRKPVQELQLNGLTKAGAQPR